MDYKYISQLLERYWRGETSLEEEQILRAFFAQLNIPSELEPYRCLFVYEQTEPKQDVLPDDFEERMLKMVGEDVPSTAHRATFSERLAPLFRAVAIVAIVLTLGNAANLSLSDNDHSGYSVVPQPKTESSVAQGDTLPNDTLRQHGPDVAQQEDIMLLKQ